MLLEASDCTHAIRCDVARPAHDEGRRRAAIAHILDYAALLDLATASTEALGEDAGDLRVVRAVCAAYTASTPYALWRELLREILGFDRNDPDADVERGLHVVIEARMPCGAYPRYSV